LIIKNLFCWSKNIIPKSPQNIYMSKHNILFFSNHQNDKLSQEMLTLLNQDQLLRDQFVTICVNSPGIKLPKMITDRNEVPVIITRGFNQPIAGQAALNWIKEHNSDKAMGLDYGDPDKAHQISEDHGILAAENNRTSYQQSFNGEWNAGAENDVRTVNSAFSNIEDTNSINTIEERGKHNTKGLKSELNRRMKGLGRQRGQEIPFPVNQQTQPIQQSQNSLQYNPIGPNQVIPPPGQQRFPQQQQQHPNNPHQFNNLNRLMSPHQTVQQPSRTSRGGVDFPPQPASNPLFPNRNNNRGGPKKGFPQIPAGFGNQNQGPSNGQFSALDSAFSGQSLMGTPMHDRNSKFNDRRGKSLSPGLPVGRGHGGTFNTMVNTSPAGNF